MKNTTNIAHSLLEALPSRLPFGAQPFRPVAALLLLLVLAPSVTFAGSAMWKTSPRSSDWNTAANWTPEKVPYLGSATFDFSNVTDVFLSNVFTFLNAIVFNQGASAFTITGSDMSSIDFYSGAGITNNSGNAQNFVVSGTDGASRSSGIRFNDNTTAGNLTFFTVNGNSNDHNLGGDIIFSGTASAANGTFTNKAGEANGAHGGVTLFTANSTAANGVFIMNGGTVKGAIGGLVVFRDTSSAANATLIANGGINSGGGGSIYFVSDSTRGPSGGKPHVELFGNGNLDISAGDAGRVTLGSIEGDGRVFLGANDLSVGSNNVSTSFSGLIRDSGGITAGIGGSLTKIGRGKLVLSHRNTYSGGTIVKRGKLIVNNQGESGTGTGPVQVEGGKLGGKGMIAGAVTIGTGGGAGAALAPGYLHGANRPGSLTIQSPLTFNSDGIYQMELDSSNVTADEVVANGVTINAGAQFSFLDYGSASLPPGTTFSAIHNTAANPIADAFVNLPDGSTFTNSGNTFKVNYKGGDGNDLTLRVQ